MDDNIHIVLVEPRYDGNVGSVARVMANFGFKNLAILNPPAIGPHGRRNSMHAKDLMMGARLFTDFSEIVDEYDFLVGTSAKIGGDGNTLRTPIFIEDLSNALEVDGKIAILFGREDYGLHNEEIECCDILSTIPTHHIYPTLNLAQSVGVVAYELSKQKNRLKYKKKKFQKAEKINKDIMLRYFDMLVDKVYERDFEGDLGKKTLRSLIGRAFISGREAKTLTGTFRKSGELIDKLKSP